MATRTVSEDERPTRRARISRDVVIDEALLLADEQGPSAVTLAAIAARLGCRAPSLYTHVDGLDDLLDAAAESAVIEFADRLRDAVMGRSGEDGVRSFAVAWRGYVSDHPGRYALSLRPASPEQRARRKAAASGATAASAAVLRSLGVADTDLADAGRTLRAALHGFAHLESEGSIGRGVDHTFMVVVDTVIAGIRDRYVGASSGADR